MRISFHSNWLLFIICFFLSIVCASGAGGAERVALVIGNGAYGTSPLKNPVNDAVDMTRLLKSLDFEVIAKTDVNKKEMVEALNSFSSKLKKSKIGLFYFAGHGMQINGRNYLIPVRVEVADEGDVEFEAVDAARIISKMKSAENMLNMVILDACRNNPFQRSFRSSSQGLARMDAPKGTIIAYATSPGAVAADGQGRNGVFTKHLLDAMAVSNLDIQNVFNEAGMAVMKETGDRQIPWLSSTPIPRFFLAGGDAGGGAMRDEQHRPGEKTIRPEPVGKPRKEAPVSLSVITTPSDSETRILNIRPPFKQGMKLDPGRYNVEVSRAGYGTETRWIELEPGVNSSIDITLQKNVSRKREQPQPPIEKKRDRVYPNGNRYEGPLVSGKAHGKGKMSYANGRSYEGQFANDKKNGYGEFRWPDGETYKGQFGDDLRNGRGISHYPNGTRYEGDFVNDKRHGRGKYFYREGTYYDGQWKDGRKHGTGVETFPNGGRYEGEYRNDEKYGKGHEVFNNGNRYTGSYANNKINGYGVMEYSSGDVRRHEGQWRDGNWNGRGKAVYYNGDRFEGDFVNGVRKGHGVYFHQNGGRFEGQYDANVPNGRGVEVFADGRRYEGNYGNGVFNGHGTMTWPNGGRFEGQFVKGGRNGQGTEWFTSGQRYQGSYRNDKPNGYGTWWYPNGNRYEGELRNGQKHGSGTMFFSNGRRIQGQWRNDRKK